MTILCKICRSELNIYRDKNKSDELLVVPCEKCFEKAGDEAYASGRTNGKQEFIDDIAGRGMGH